MLKNQRYGIAKSYTHRLIHYDGVGGYKDTNENSEFSHNYVAMIMIYYVFLIVVMA